MKVKNQKAKEVRSASDKTQLSEREVAMQQEIQKLKKANEILKDTLVFLVVDQKK